LDEAKEEARKITHHLAEWDEIDYDGEYDENEEEKNNDKNFDDSMGCEVVDTETRTVVYRCGYEL
jgi:hypothetical protein